MIEFKNGSKIEIIKSEESIRSKGRMIVDPFDWIYKDLKWHQKVLYKLDDIKYGICKIIYKIKRWRHWCR